MPTQQPTNAPRQLAWQCLCRWAKGGVFAEALISGAGRRLAPADRAMLQAIVLGVLRHLRMLDALLMLLRGGRHVQENARWLLLSGLCQLFVLRWPAYAVVNEVVGMAPAKLRPLVNGVLRQALRSEQVWSRELENMPPGIRFSMPDWIVERWHARFGEAECHALLQKAGEPAAVCARVNAIRPLPMIPPGWQPIPEAEGWYCLGENPLPLEAIQAGQIYIADPSTRYSVQLLAPRPGEFILDACAAPGGKSAGILSATLGQCRLVATDAEAHRLPQLRENLSRVGANGVDIEQHDWTRPCPSKWRAAFDAALVDVPCSNSGVFQRRVDARWRLTPHELRKLTQTQLKITENVLRSLKPGGRLVYSTCSIEPEEDSLLVEKLLSRHPECSLESDFLALPHRVSADGAYAALIRKQ